MFRLFMLKYSIHELSCKVLSMHQFTLGCKAKQLPDRTVFFHPFPPVLDWKYRKSSPQHV